MDRDAEVIAADEACDAAARELEMGRRERGETLSEKQREAFARRRTERADIWAEQLPTEVRVVTSKEHSSMIHCVPLIALYEGDVIGTNKSVAVVELKQTGVLKFSRFTAVMGH